MFTRRRPKLLGQNVVFSKEICWKKTNSVVEKRKGASGQAPLVAVQKALLKTVSLVGKRGDRNPNNIFALCTLISLTSTFPTMYVRVNFVLLIGCLKKFFRKIKKPEKPLKTPWLQTSSQLVNRAESWYTASTHPSAKKQAS